MRESQRRYLVRNIDKRWGKIKVDLWEVYKWAEMANFPSKSGGGGSGQKGEGDPVGEKAVAAASGHFDDPSIKGAKESDSALYKIIKNLEIMERAIATTKPPHVMSDRDREQCVGACGTFRFEKPMGWTLGFCNACYAAERRKAKRRKK